MIQIPEDSFAGRLKFAIGERKESVNAVASRAGIRESLIRSYFKGTAPSIDVAAKLARALGVRVGWLIDGEVPVHTTARLAQFIADVGAEQGQLDHAGFTLVPRYDLQVPASIGGALVTAEEIVDHLAFKTSWLRDVLHVALDKIGLLSAIGDSMEPTIIAGDLLLLELNPEHLIEGAIYVLALDGLMKVKRIQRLTDGTMLIRSDNPKYEPDRIPPEKAEHQLRIIGRVRWSGRVL